MLTRQEWRVLLEAAALTPPAAVAVRVLPLPKAVTLVLTIACCRRPRRVATGALMPSLDRLATLVEWSASRFRSRCLVQALVLQAVLRRRGLRAEVVLGAAPGASVEDSVGGLRAHAWVEHDGAVVMGDVPVPYVPLCRLNGDQPVSTGPTGQGALV